MHKIDLPQFDALMNPLLKALKALGDSGSITEIENKVAEILQLTDTQLELLHTPGKSSQFKNEFCYRLAWTRTYLKKYGVIENSARGIWALMSKGSKLPHVNEKEVVRFYKDQYKNAPKPPLKTLPEGLPDDSLAWRDELSEVLSKMEPNVLERLLQRVLRESGFVQVEVTGKTGDGGIDGHGIMRLGGLLSFHVIFQCKRWQGSVGPGQVRDFRGAMVGRADKALFITTGTFTKEAIREASRDGAPTIDLMNGEQLLDALKELALGVQTKKEEIEKVSIDREWFTNL